VEKILLLFDIDGTLLTSGGAGVHALRLGLKDQFGIDDDLDGIEIAGRTDSAIARQVLAKHALPETAENLAAFFDGYLYHLALLLPKMQGRLLPGVLSLLAALQSRDEAVLAILTGNLARGAELKLTHYGVWHFFEFGAYADDHHDRNQLGHFAKTRACERHGIEFPAQRIFVLGDTPHDVSCARAIGAQAVAIATGNFSREQLAAAAPDYLFDDLSEVNAVLHALGLSQTG
jgi:phosphoglycolate phosphatase-like HAD superfamily hydrolase